MKDELTTIIQAAQHGDETAFRKLIERYYHYVHRVTYRVLLNNDAARDAAQETFIKLWRRIGSFNTAMNFTTWLYRITSNTALDAHRAQTRRAQAEHTSATPDRAVDTVERETEDREFGEIIRTLLQYLPPAQRLIFALRDVEDLSIADVASVTGMSTASIKTNLSFARRKVREHLSHIYSTQGTER